MRGRRITLNPLCGTHQMKINLARESHETICQGKQWNDYGCTYRIGRNSHLARPEAERIVEGGKPSPLKSWKSSGDSLNI